MVLDPRNLARVRTQVWFAEMALQGMQVEAGEHAEPLLGPIIRLLALAQIHLSDRIDDAGVRRVEPLGSTGSGGPR